MYCMVYYGPWQHNVQFYSRRGNVGKFFHNVGKCSPTDHKQKVAFIQFRTQTFLVI